MGYLADQPITFISEDAYKKWMVRGFPKPGDILFVTEGHTMGFVALNTRTDEFALAQRTITLQPAVSFNTKFFFYFMMSEHFQDLVKLNATGAAAVGMKGSKFRTLPLAFPPIAEQRKIVCIVDDFSVETQRLESIYQRKLSALDELKKSLLHQAFSGQL
jgi:type I restriction enzyme S subunit